MCNGAAGELVLASGKLSDAEIWQRYGEGIDQLMRELYGPCSAASYAPSLPFWLGGTV